MTDTPAISVIMSVYNAQDDVKAAIDSILAQNFTDFEFIIIDDGSSDNSADIIKSYDDPRIKLHSQKNTGLTKALNKGVSLAKGRYIARQDADDVSYPQRLQKQFEILESRPDVNLLGSNADDHYPDGYKAQWGHYDEDELQRIVYFKTPFPHSSAMMRTDIIRKLGGYDESFKTAQDMELWMRFAAQGPIAMIKEPLIQRGVGAGAISTKRRWRQAYDALRARWRHNAGTGRALAVYHALRSLLISLVPYSLVKRWRSAKGHS